MTILAIDPGPMSSAFVLWSNGRIAVHGIEANEEVIGMVNPAVIEAAVGSRRSQYLPCVIVEWIESYGMPVGRDVFETIRWIGRFEERWLSHRDAHESRFSRITRREIKLALCGSARAKDANVRASLLDRVGPKGTKGAPGPTYGIRSHEWSALAVAVAYRMRIAGEKSAATVEAMER